MGITRPCHTLWLHGLDWGWVMVLLGPMSSRHGSRNGSRHSSCPIHGFAGALVSRLGKIVAICNIKSFPQQLKLQVFEMCQVQTARCRSTTCSLRPCVLQQAQSGLQVGLLQVKVQFMTQASRIWHC